MQCDTDLLRMRLPTNRDYDHKFVCGAKGAKSTDELGLASVVAETAAAPQQPQPQSQRSPLVANHGCLFGIICGDDNIMNAFELLGTIVGISDQTLGGIPSTYIYMSLLLLMYRICKSYRHDFSKICVGLAFLGCSCLRISIMPRKPPALSLRNTNPTMMIGYDTVFRVQNLSWTCFHVLTWPLVICNNFGQDNSAECDIPL